MQGLADGYFIVPHTVGNYLASTKIDAIDVTHPAFKEAEKNITDFNNKLFSINGQRTVDDIHKELGKIMWDNVGMARNKENLKQAINEIKKLKQEFWSNVKVPDTNDEFNPELEKAGRLIDFIELGELMARDALNREESCGGHFREEYQTEENEAKRNDDSFAFVSAWEYKDSEPKLHKEELEFENVKLTTRSYK